MTKVMSHLKAIFLSASVPEVGRAGSDDFDAFLIKEAVTALIEVILGRYLLVWGGQPAITPMIWEASRRYNVSYPGVVTLYQSAYWKGRYPKTNTAFGNFVETEAVPSDKVASLAKMRNQMLSNHDFHGGVFIGGMEGVLNEYEIFKSHNPRAVVLPIPSPGGTSRILFQGEQREGRLPKELEDAVDFTYWFQKLLDVDLSIPRAHSLKDQ